MRIHKLLVVCLSVLCAFCFTGCGGSGGGSETLGSDESAVLHTVRGTIKVLGEDGQLKAVPEALVRLYPSENAAERAAENLNPSLRMQNNISGLQTYTDQNGVYEINNVPRGEYTLVAKKGDALQAVKTNIMLNGNSETEQTVDDISLRPCGTIKGSVVCEGKNIQDLLLILDPNLEYYAITDENGIFTFESIPFGTYKLGIQPVNGIVKYSIADKPQNGSITLNQVDFYLASPVELNAIKPIIPTSNNTIDLAEGLYLPMCQAVSGDSLYCLRRDTDCNFSIARYMSDGKEISQSMTSRFANSINPCSGSMVFVGGVLHVLIMTDSMHADVQNSVYTYDRNLNFIKRTNFDFFYQPNTDPNKKVKSSNSKIFAFNGKPVIACTLKFISETNQIGNSEFQTRFAYLEEVEKVTAAETQAEIDLLKRIPNLKKYQSFVVEDTVSFDSGLGETYILFHKSHEIPQDQAEHEVVVVNLTTGKDYLSKIFYNESSGIIYKFMPSDVFSNSRFNPKKLISYRNLGEREGKYYLYVINDLTTLAGKTISENDYLIEWQRGVLSCGVEGLIGHFGYFDNSHRKYIEKLGTDKKKLFGNIKIREVIEPDNYNDFDLIIPPIIISDSFCWKLCPIKEIPQSNDLAN